MKRTTKKSLSSSETLAKTSSLRRMTLNPDLPGSNRTTNHLGGKAASAVGQGLYLRFLVDNDLSFRPPIMDFAKLT